MFTDTATANQVEFAYAGTTTPANMYTQNEFTKRSI